MHGFIIVSTFSRSIALPGGLFLFFKTGVVFVDNHSPVWQSDYLTAWFLPPFNSHSGLKGLVLRSLPPRVHVLYVQPLFPQRRAKSPN